MSATRKQFAIFSEGKRVFVSNGMPMYIALNGLSRQVRWSSLSKDLVEIATAVLLADRIIRRPSRGIGPRRIALTLPCRNPEMMTKALPHVQDALNILSEDRFSFDFHHADTGACHFPEISHSQNTVLVDRVALFSGGLDSAAAAATFYQKKIQCAYVTHYVGGIRRIRQLLENIRDANRSDADVHHAQFYIRPDPTVTSSLRETSRRTRSFLYVSLALAVANALKAREVCVCENGPLAVNIPLSRAMVSTRHAHSTFLRATKRMAEALFGEELRVFNPFELKTKGEMSRVFVSRPQLALRTISCWNQQWSGKGKAYSKGHCGYCLPCLVRRAALDSAGIDFPKSHFDIDVRKLAKRTKLSERNSLRLGVYRALRSFSAQIHSCTSWKQFIRCFPECVLTEATEQSLSSEMWLKKLYKVMKRFADEIDVAFDGTE